MRTATVVVSEEWQLEDMAAVHEAGMAFVVGMAEREHQKAEAAVEAAEVEARLQAGEARNQEEGHIA